MKNKSQIAITIGLMCMLLTSAIAIQLNTIKEATKIVGSPYAKQGLKDEVLRRKEEYEYTYKVLGEKENELEKVRQEVTKENGRGTSLQEELSNANKLMGLTELTGSGIIVTVSDNNNVKAKDLDESVDNISYYLVHDEDLVNIVNELNNAGAEAISINGQRIISTTAITCSGAVISINGIKLSSPFKISAIGNPESLSGIARPGGWLQYMEPKVITNIEKSNNVTVAKYNGVITPKYMESID